MKYILRYEMSYKYTNYKYRYFKTAISREECFDINESMKFSLKIARYFKKIYLYYEIRSFIQ